MDFSRVDVNLPRPLRINAAGCACAKVLTTWMPQDEDGGASWKSRRSTQVAASVLLLIDSHPLVLSNMVRAWQPHRPVTLPWHSKHI